MKIRAIIWPEDQVEHIARHGVTPEEFEEVCFGRSLVRRMKAKGKNPVYTLEGQTQTGRYLICMLVRFPDGNGFPVSAREMTTKEKRRFRRGKRL